MGLFVFAAIAVLAMLVIRAGDLYIRPGYNITLIFDTVSGIEKGSPIKLAGFPVGKVMKFLALRDVEGRTMIHLDAFLDEGVLIEEDADIRVATMGFLGEKYIEIRPGTPGAKTVGAGAILVGKQLTGVDDLFDSGQQLIQRAEYMVNDLREVVGDAEFKKSLKGTFVNSEKTFANLESAAADLKAASASAKVVLSRLENGEGSIGKLLKDEKIAKDIEAFVEDIKKNPWKLLKK